MNNIYELVSEKTLELRLFCDEQGISFPIYESAFELLSKDASMHSLLKISERLKYHSISSLKQKELQQLYHWFSDLHDINKENPVILKSYFIYIKQIYLLIIEAQTLYYQRLTNITSKISFYQESLLLKSASRLQTLEAMKRMELFFCDILQPSIKSDQLKLYTLIDYAKIGVNLSSESGGLIKR
ncbi:hypothetical protein JTI58_12350 [Lysinibacillus fusiformis]|uniref:hypothetical protein n=1 Tax=Lysinibacillus fusiformis TaxID=28031 RepID=UPI0019684767|nr:hypothetical protein [Lysinibacillus fusiformis]QSB07854.1 hypothetical protein JTI58_12350 [Lysinibacillus fusiformis]